MVWCVGRRVGRAVGHRLIVATHLARRDNVAARRVLRRYRDAVHDLGVDPSEATRMVERLLERLPWPSASETCS
jgi:DNA/RNA-binding domain of Phe-tRNA-synthetase-like protein